MADQLTLHPIDVAVALRLAEGSATFDMLRRGLGVSTSTAHAAVRRLEAAGLIRPGTREVNRAALLEFLEHGVRYAFPARPGPPTTGVATAHAGPALSQEFGTQDALVWPAPNGPTTGLAVTPLYPQAVELPQRAPQLYWKLSLVDALRVGRVRERRLAAERLRASLIPHAAGV